MKNFCRILLAVAMTLSLFLLVACGKDKTPTTEEPTSPPHTSDGKYQSDENTHWFGCTACDEHRYGEEAHTFVANGKNKKCSACGREAEYTEEENVLFWIACRDATLAFKGGYTVRDVFEYDNEGDKCRIVECESWDGSKRYLRIRADYMMDENGTYSENYRTTNALLPVSGGSFPRSILYYAEYDGDTGSTDRSAQYVSPDYSDDDRRYEPSGLLEDYGVESGSDYAGLVAGILASMDDSELEAETTVSLERGEDGSVTLCIHVTAVGAYANDETGKTGTCTVVDIYRLVAKDGRIVSIAEDCRSTVVYDSDDGTFTLDEKYFTEIAYDAFDNATYDGIDISGVEITDAYYCYVNLHPEGTDTVFTYGDALMGGDVTAKTLCDYLASLYSRFVGFDDTDSEKAFEIYTDPQMTNRFTGMTLLEEDVDLYFCLKAPDDAAIVITIFRGETGDRLQIAYLWNDERFYPRSLFADHKVLSINGEPVGEYASFACEKGRIYTVVYDDTGAEVPTVEHKALPEWIHNEYAHWHGCTECGYETFDYSPHNDIIRDGMKVCSVCGYTVPFTDEENYAIVSAGIGFSKNAESVYSYRLIHEILDAATGDVKTRRLFSEARAYSQYFSVTEMYYANEDGTLALMARDLNAYKYLSDISRWKWYTERTAPDGSLQKTGTLKKPSFSLDDYVRFCSPAAFVEQMALGCGGSTYEEFCTLFAAACAQAYENSYGGECTVSGFSMRRNDDGTVTLFYTVEGSYTDAQNTDEGYTGNSYTGSCRLTVSEYGIVGYSESSADTTHNEDETKNSTFAWQTAETYSSEFDSETYDAISVETDTTTDEYVASVSFIINGYHYGYSMSGLPVDSSFTLSDVQNFLADVGENAGKPLFTHDVDPEMFNVYYDETMEMPFVKWDVENDDPITLYVDMVIPEDKAIVIVVYDYGTAQGIHLCYLRDLGATFDTAKLYITNYPLVEADGEEITDGADRIITCNESRIYTVVYRVG